MLEPNKDQKRLPIGGHHYTTHGVTFKGETLADVVQKLKDFRLNNSIPVGDPQQEILHFYAAHWPYMVKESEAKPLKYSTPSDYEAWRDYVYRAWRKPITKFLTSKEAEVRWEVCKTCPFNKKKDWRMTPESSEVAKKAFLLRRGVPVPDFLGYCSLHKTDIGSSVFLDNPALMSSKKDGDNPSGCWVS